MGKWFGTQVTIILLLIPVVLQAAERRDLEGGQIRGAQEAPKAIFIMPWRTIKPEKMSALELNTLFREALSPIEKSDLQRDLQLYQITQERKQRNNQ